MPGIQEVTPNLSAMASKRPTGEATGYIRNLLIDDDEESTLPSTMAFWFRPNPIREHVGNSREAITVMGMSHQYKNYSYTENMTISFSLYSNALMIIKEIGRTRQLQNNEQGRRAAVAEGAASDVRVVSMMLEDDRRFLEALNYPGWTPQGTIGSDLPPCILCLPGIVAMRCNLNSLDVDFTKVDLDGNIMELTANVVFEEAPLSRITMQDVMEVGSFRTWGA